METKDLSKAVMVDVKFLKGTATTQAGAVKRLTARAAEKYIAEGLAEKVKEPEVKEPKVK